MYDYMLLYVQRVEIPTTLLGRMLMEFYNGYPGISRIKLFMKSQFDWPKMELDSEELVNREDRRSIF